ncbi:MAG: hypothetical protein PHQ23_15465, partial [Candidatus Wallbacteria bacterium]|nr:hypothetical protein [Candidatus Wallbacteria bacterium]
MMEKIELKIMESGSREEKLAFLKTVFTGFCAMDKSEIRHFLEIEKDEFITATLISCYGRVCCMEDAGSLLPFLDHCDA